MMATYMYALILVVYIHVSTKATRFKMGIIVPIMHIVNPALSKLEYIHPYFEKDKMYRTRNIVNGTITKQTLAIH